MAPGATKEAWQLLMNLGLTADLLPVVSDASIKISERSKMEAVGKTPSVINREGCAVGIPRWTERISTPADIKAWSNDPRLGICLQTREVRAFDVDINDPAVSAEVRGFVETLAGTLPCRSRSNSGKLLLAFRMPGSFHKRRIVSEHGMIEFLATGQQFIAEGTHTSGVRYEWDGLEHGIPALEQDEFEAIWSALCSHYGDGEQANTTHSTTSHDDPVLGLCDDDIRQALSVLSPTMGYDEWLQVGQAIHHETRGAGLHLWDEWSDSEGAEYPGADVLEAKWNSFGRNAGPVVTGRTLLHIANLAAADKGVTLTILQAKPEEFPIIEARPTDPEPLPDFKRDKTGGIEPTMTNAVRAVKARGFCGANIAYDEFKDATLVAWGGEHEWRGIKDTDYTRLRVVLEQHGFKRPGRELVRDAVLQVAEDNAFDSAIQWAESLTWDGVPRVEHFLECYMGADCSDYSRAVSRYMWTALAARAMQPGAKCDMVPVLVGGQGTGKSTGVMAMSPSVDAYVEVNLEHRDDNLARSLRGKLVGELGELRGLMTRDAEAIKAWVTRTHEEWIPKYMEFSTKFPRRLMFIGTTNSDEFLADDTGERRWLPVRVGKVDTDAIARDRDQLWAEGIVMWRKAGLDWREAMDLATDHHADFKVTDAWEEAIRRWLLVDNMDDDQGTPRGQKPFKLDSLLAGALGIEAKAQDLRMQKRAASILRQLGFEKRRATRAEGGKSVWEKTAICSLLLGG